VRSHRHSTGAAAVPATVAELTPTIPDEAVSNP
jgi:hypothetical protein